MNNTDLNANSIFEIFKSFVKDTKSFINIQDNTFIGHADNVYTGKKHQKYQCPTDIFTEAVAMLAKAGYFVDIQDICCLYYLDLEMSAVGFCSIPDFCTRIKDFVPEEFNPSLLPKAPNVQKISIGSHPFPNWNWDSFGTQRVPHIRALCWAYVRFMYSRGLVHPCMNNANFASEE